MQSRRYNFGHDRPSLPDDEMDSMMTDDFDKMRERFHNRARNMNFRQDNGAFDRWFEHGEESAFQPRFKIPKEDERSSYVRNIPIFTEDDSTADRNLMRQATSAVPRAVPPPFTGPQQQQTQSHPQQQRRAASPIQTPPAQHKLKQPTTRHPSSASDSGIDRGTSGSPSDISDSVSSASLPRFNYSKSDAPQISKTKFQDKGKDIPIKVEISGGKSEPIPMGFLPKQRDPKEAIPLGYYDRPASAPGDPPHVQEKKSDKVQEQPEVDAKVHRVPIVVKQQTATRSASAPPKRTEITPPPSTTGEPAMKAKSPLEKIEDIVSGVQQLESRIKEFKGSRQDHEYRQLDELLTQSMLKLDDVATDGIDEIRNIRKAAVKRIDDLVGLLESKAPLTAASAGKVPKKSPSVSTTRADTEANGSAGPHRIVIAMNPNGEKKINNTESVRPMAKETMII